MAVITDYVGYIEAVSHKYIATSSPAAVGDTVLLTGLDPNHTHWFLGIHIFDASGDRATPADGEFTVSVLTENTGDNITATPDDGTFEDPPVTTITAVAPVTVDWSANTVGVKVVNSTNLTADHTWKVVVTSNRS